LHVVFSPTGNAFADANVYTTSMAQRKG